MTTHLRKQYLVELLLHHDCVLARLQCLSTGRGDERRVDKPCNSQRRLFCDAQKYAQLLPRKTAGYAQNHLTGRRFGLGGEAIEVCVSEVGEVPVAIAGQATCRQRIKA